MFFWNWTVGGKYGFTQQPILKQCTVLVSILYIDFFVQHFYHADFSVASPLTKQGITGVLSLRVIVVVLYTVENQAPNGQKISSCFPSSSSSVSPDVRSEELPPLPPRHVVRPPHPSQRCLHVAPVLGLLGGHPGRRVGAASLPLAHRLLVQGLNLKKIEIELNCQFPHKLPIFAHHLFVHPGPLEL